MEQNLSNEAMETLRTIWDSLYTENALTKADIIIAFGCADPNVAKRAAKLWLDGYAPYLLLSGGLGKGTQGRLMHSEAEEYAAIAEKMGVPRQQMLLETKSTNTGDNVRFSYALLQKRGMEPKKAIAVHQPNMGKRILATLEKRLATIST